MKLIYALDNNSKNNQAIFHRGISKLISGKNHKFISMTKNPKIAILSKSNARSFINEVCLERPY